MSVEQDLSITVDTTIRDAMQQLDQTAGKCLFVVDKHETLIGALSDGDVRRAILKGHGLDETVEGLYNTTPLAIADGTAVAGNEQINAQASHIMHERNR